MWEAGALGRCQRWEGSWPVGIESEAERRGTVGGIGLLTIFLRGCVEIRRGGTVVPVKSFTKFCRGRVEIWDEVVWCVGKWGY